MYPDGGRRGNRVIPTKPIIGDRKNEIANHTQKFRFWFFAPFPTR